MTSMSDDVITHLILFCVHRKCASFAVAGRPLCWFYGLLHAVLFNGLDSSWAVMGVLQLIDGENAMFVWSIFRVSCIDSTARLPITGSEVGHIQWGGAIKLTKYAALGCAVTVATPWQSVRIPAPETSSAGAR